MRQRKRARGRLETHVLVCAAVAGEGGRVVVVVVVVFLLSSSFAEFNSRSCRRRWCSDDDLFVAIGIGNVFASFCGRSSFFL